MDINVTSDITGLSLENPAMNAVLVDRYHYSYGWAIFSSSNVAVLTATCTHWDYPMLTTRVVLYSHTRAYAFLIHKERDSSSPSI